MTPRFLFSDGADVHPTEDAPATAVADGCAARPLTSDTAVSGELRSLLFDEQRAWRALGLKIEVMTWLYR